ncbi:putative ABC transport system ATP-binding protein [Actinoalloteichus hoggarensis]|uniref:Lipoprotein-releasing system ATP-binding protein LolD n=1 Tax=Actinoalloteichus hoggarensis TaxID=1470176 RepID=A0A221W2S6_9PSEU|nr:ATP-binding cassette domain-containing protein [Actinoalloteichus hoggarensis]ASO20098.1 Lipoprotein-releasing system ATP-binding protein LolD [Actinoalloteichus hoggarensis]MBB5919190.1 putative ABC transport system ATP-binding protein [Actinoalloteichus hoggarensis]
MSEAGVLIDTVVLRARGVRRSFPQGTGRVEVLRGVDLAVSAGEVVTLSGPSGSGKSALFSVLCGFDEPDAGEVLILGEPMSPMVAWHVVSVLPQAMGLADELTLAENVALPLRLAPGEVAARLGDVDGRVTELLTTLQVDHLAERYPSEVSFGQQQRVALARALAIRPRLLLADEPTAHLDHEMVGAVLGLLHEAAGDGTCVLLSTHDDEVRAAADRRLRIVDGLVTEG